MTAQKPHTDGALKPARTKLRHTIDALLELFNQLLDATPPPTNTRTAPKSQPPLWIDAISLIEEIRAGVAKLIPESVSSTIGRLTDLRARKWRPQDTQTIEHITVQLENWAQRIDMLLNPHKMHIAAACPACNTRTVRRKDITGEYTHQPALQIREHGCECMNCHHIWAPTLYQHLANVLGCPKPQGVLE